MRYLLLILAASLVGCQSETTEAPAEATEAAPAAVEEVTESTSLAALLDAQPEEVKARYQYRNPEQTLEFFEAIRQHLKALEERELVSPKTRAPER